MAAKLALIAILVAAVPTTLPAQDTTKPKPDSARAGMMDHHMAGPWKEMNAFHHVLGATWHPADHEGNLAPLKSRAKELLNTAPATPAGCGSDAVRGAATKVAMEMKALVALLDSRSEDAKLKAALKGVHDAFEIAEKGCAGHGGHGDAR
jgi:hypothetical protein